MSKNAILVSYRNNNKPHSKTHLHFYGMPQCVTKRGRVTGVLVLRAIDDTWSILAKLLQLVPGLNIGRISLLVIP